MVGDNDRGSIDWHASEVLVGYLICYVHLLEHLDQEMVFAVAFTYVRVELVEVFQEEHALRQTVGGREKPLADWAVEGCLDAERAVGIVV